MLLDKKNVFWVTKKLKFTLNSKAVPWSLFDLNILLSNDSDETSFIKSSEFSLIGNMVVSGTINNPELNNNTTNINTISGNVNNWLNGISVTGSAALGYTVNIGSNAITITGNNVIGYSINIGNIISNVFINGALYLNGDLVVRQRNNENYYANAVEFAQYINQI